MYMGRGPMLGIGIVAAAAGIYAVAATGILERDDAADPVCVSRFSGERLDEDLCNGISSDYDDGVSGVYLWSPGYDNDRRRYSVPPVGQRVDLSKGKAPTYRPPVYSGSGAPNVAAPKAAVPSSPPQVKSGSSPTAVQRGGLGNPAAADANKAAKASGGTGLGKSGGS